MHKRYGIVLSLMLGVLAGCEDAPECDYIDAARCSADGKGILSCDGKRWVESPCGAGLACANIGSGVYCVDEAALSVCVPGTTHCYDGGVLQTCSAQGRWEFSACGTNMACRNGVCREVSSVTVPDDPAIPDDPVVTEVVTVRCNGADVEYVDAEGGVKRMTCLEDVGFAGRCETFSNGLAGCALPSGCDEAFSQAGTCAGERRLWCDARYIVPKPSVDDCAASGGHCVVDGGAAYCVKACSASALSCTKVDGVEQVASCREFGNASGLRTGISLCASESMAVSCANGAVVEAACAQDEACYDSVGRCAPKCSEADLDKVMCRADGEVLQCQKIFEGYAYVSVGRRHCLGDLLVQCAEGQDGYALKEVDCSAYEKDGEVIAGICVTDYNYYEDMDICLADVEGQPCGSLTNDGICDGNILRYCDDTYHLASEADCSKNKDGFNTCSVYEGFADCRQKCAKAGAASCSYSESYEGYLVTLCAPDAQTGATVEINGASVCLGDSLYSCDAEGKTAITDCAAFGGRCDVDACVYPACRLSEDAVCLAGGGGLSCSVREDGSVAGMMIDKKMCK